MPLLKHLLEELGLIDQPEKVKLSGETYDSIVAEIKEISDEEEE